MVAVPLIFGRLTAEDYEDTVAGDPRIDSLRSKMQVRENTTFTQEYYASDKRYIGNAIQVQFRDGTSTPRVQVDFPIGHRKRRAEGMPVLVKKFEQSVAAHFQPKQAARILQIGELMERAAEAAARATDDGAGEAAVAYTEVTARIGAATAVGLDHASGAATSKDSSRMKTSLAAHHDGCDGENE